MIFKNSTNFKYWGSSNHMLTTPVATLSRAGEKLITSTKSNMKFTTILATIALIASSVDGRLSEPALSTTEATFK